MNLRICALAFILTVSNHSEANLRCERLFDSPKVYATQLDKINSDNNDQLFDISLDKILNPDLINKSIFENLNLRYKSFKLNNELKQLKDADNWSDYDFQNFSKKLSKLTYLTSNSVDKNLTKTEKALILEARHKVLTEGLKNYFFSENKTPLSIQRKVFNIIMLPFEEMYFRWTYALFMMPKLNGTVISLEDAKKIIWTGLDSNPDLIAKYKFDLSNKPWNYLNTVQGKMTFNQLSKFYNWSLVTIIFAGLPTFGYLKISEMQQSGQEQVNEMFKTMTEKSEIVANMDYHKLAADKDLNDLKESFKETTGRDPTEAEIAFLQKRSAKKN